MIQDTTENVAPQYTLRSQGLRLPDMGIDGHIGYKRLGLAEADQNLEDLS